MAERLTPDEAFGSSLPTADQAFGDPNKQQGSYAGGFADWFFTDTSEGRLLSAFGQGAKQGWGDQTGAAVREADEWLAKAGIFNDDQSNHKNIVKSINETFFRPIIHGSIAIGKAVGSGLGAVTGLTGQAGEEIKKLPIPGAGGAGEILGGVATGFLAPEMIPVHKARAVGAIAEGETGFFNTVPITNENFQARATAAREAGLPEPIPQPPVVDINFIARQVNPAAFDRYDTLRAAQDNSRTSLDYLSGRIRDKVERDIYSILSPVEGNEAALGSSQASRLANLRGLLEEVSNVDSPAMAAHREALIKADADIQKLFPELAKARDIAKEYLASDSKESKIFRNYVQAKLFERDLELESLSGEIRDAYRHAEELLPIKEPLSPSASNKPVEGLGGSLDGKSGKVGTPVLERKQGTPEASQGLSEGVVEPAPLEPRVVKPSDRLLNNKTFTTSKGSKYTLHEDGTTSRDKAARPDIGHEGQSGPQPRSQRTYFVTEEQMNRLGEFQNGSTVGKVITERPDGSIGVRYTSGTDAGKYEKRTVVTPSTSPTVGLYPIEIWKDGGIVHFGNKITDVKEATRETGKTRPEGRTSTTSTKTVESDTEVGLARNIQAKALEEKLTTDFGELPGYKKISIKEEAKVAQKIAEDKELSIRILNHEEEIPAGLTHRESLLIAVEEKAIREKDIETLRALAHSETTKETSILAQRFRTLAEREKESPSALMNKIEEARVKFSKEGDINAVVDDLKDHIKNNTKFNKEVWKDFIDSVTCT